MNKKKIELFEEWMKADHILIHLDARAEGVVVPENHSQDPALTLKLSYLFQGVTTHDDLAISVYLKFQGIYKECVIPWSAIWGMSSEKNEQFVWPESLPAELLAGLTLTPEEPPSTPHLQIATENQITPESKAFQTPPKEEIPTGGDKVEQKVRHLRRVK